MKRTLITVTPTFRGLLVLLALTLAQALSGQDTLGKRSVQAEFGTIPSSFRIRASMEQLQALQPEDDNLLRDFSGYSDNGIVIYNRRLVQWYLGLTYYGKLSHDKGLSWSVGLKYRQALLGGRGFSFDSIIARDTFSNNNGQTLVRYQNISNLVNIVVGAHEVLVPASMYWTGRKERLIWVEPGLQVTPGVILGARYFYDEVVAVRSIILPPEEEVPQPYWHQWTQDTAIYSSRSLPAKGTGYSISVGLPVTLYLRGSKTHHFLRRIEVFGNLTPFMRYSFFRGLPAQSYSAFSASFGIRYRL